MKLTTCVCPECGNVLRLDVQKELFAFGCPYCRAQLAPAKRGFAVHLTVKAPPSVDMTYISDALIHIARNCDSSADARAYYEMALSVDPEQRGAALSIVQIDLAGLLPDNVPADEAIEQLMQLDPKLTNYAALIDKGCTLADDAGKFVYEHFRKLARRWILPLNHKAQQDMENGLFRGDAWVQKTIWHHFDPLGEGWLARWAQWLDKMGALVSWNGVRALSDELILQLPKRALEIQRAQARLVDPEAAQAFCS